MADSCIKLGTGLQEAMRHNGNNAFKAVTIRPHIMHRCLRPEQFQISSDRYMDLNKPGFVLFTSATTGPPKGAVRRRGALYEVATQFSDQHGIREGDTVLHTLPVHHATGITVTLLPFLWSGGCIEFRSGGFDTAWTWERIRQADLDFFSPPLTASSAFTPLTSPVTSVTNAPYAGVEVDGQTGLPGGLTIRPLLPVLPSPSTSFKANRGLGAINASHHVSADSHRCLGFGTECTGVEGTVRGPGTNAVVVVG